MVEYHVFLKEHPQPFPLKFRVNAESLRSGFAIIVATGAAAKMEIPMTTNRNNKNIQPNSRIGVNATFLDCETRKFQSSEGAP